jgi:predicted transposase/invertase (TIGR01784 family)
MQSYDQAYKNLFLHPQLVQELLESFVQQEWVKELDFTRLTDISAEYFGTKNQKRQSDLLFRIPLQGQELAVFVVLLLEFQSDNYPWMVVRMLEYVGLFYRKYVRQHPKTDTLPVVFPFVLYNGTQKWRSVSDIQEIMAKQPQLPAEYQLRFRYFKLAVNEQDPQTLTELGNAVSSLLLAEQNIDNIDTVAELFTRLLNNPNNREVVQHLVEWYQTLVSGGKLPEAHGTQLEQAIQAKEQLQTMLREQLRELRQQERQEGREEGREEGISIGLEQGLEKGLEKGREEGREEGELNAILLLLEMAVGPQPEPVKKQVQALVEREGFKAIAARIFSAKTIADVLEGE